MRKAFVGVFVLLITLMLFALPVSASASQETCLDGDGWVKINSGDLSLYPVDGATEYCFKASTFLTDTIPNGGFGQDGACEEGHIERCDLSHWSYFIPEPPPPEICDDELALNYGKEEECDYAQPPEDPPSEPVPPEPVCGVCPPPYREIVTDVQLQWYGADCFGNCLGKWRVITTNPDVRLLDLLTGEMIEPTYVNDGGSFGPFYIFDNLSWELSYIYRIVMTDGTPVWEYFGHLTEKRTVCSSWPYYAFNDSGAWYLESMIRSDMLLVAMDAWGMSYSEALEWSTNLSIGWNDRP